jgi:streptogramin lyase
MTARATRTLPVNAVRSSFRPRLEALEDRCTPSYVPIIEYPIAPNSSNSIAKGPDGNMWFTESATGKIDRITPAGAITEFTPAGVAFPSNIISAPDGNLWFIDGGGSSNQLARMTVLGAVTFFAAPTANPQIAGLTVGPDGNLWFTESLASKIGKVTLGTTPTITDSPLPAGTFPGTIISAFGELFYIDAQPNQKIGSYFTTGGFGISYNLGQVRVNLTDGIVAGRDGNLWVAEGSIGGLRESIGRPRLSPNSNRPVGSMCLRQKGLSRGQTATCGSVSVHLPLPANSLLRSTWLEFTLSIRSSMHRRVPPESRSQPAPMETSGSSMGLRTLSAKPCYPNPS